MFFHWQNLAREDRRPGVPSRHWLHGRAWLRGEGSWSLRAEWLVRRAGWRLGVETGRYGEPEMLVYATVGLVGWYLGIAGRWFRNLPSREIALRAHDGALWWAIWTPVDEWSRGTPWWRSGHLRPADVLLGRRTYSSEMVSQIQTVIPMPEGAYPCVVNLTVDRWRRRRWPWGRTLRRATVLVEGGVPHPGKGENAWDCGEDGTYSLTTPADTVEDAVAAFVRSVLRDRRRHGGTVNWRPSVRA